MPPNAVMAITMFRSIALGEFIKDIIPINLILDPMKEKLEMLSKMGAMLLIGVLMIIVVIPVIIVLKFCPPGKIRSLFNRIKEKLFWNFFIRYVLQSYLKMSIICLLAFPEFTFETAMGKANAAQ